MSNGQLIVMETRIAIALLIVMATVLASTYGTWEVSGQQQGVGEKTKRGVDRKKMSRLSNILAKGFFKFSNQRDSIVDAILSSNRMTEKHIKRESVRTSSAEENRDASKGEDLPPFLMKARDTYETLNNGDTKDGEINMRTRYSEQFVG